MNALFGVVVLVLTLGLAALVLMARQGRFRSRTLLAMAVASSAALVLMLVSDWPTEVLSAFWARHPVLEGVLGTLLLVGIGFFAFELRETQESSRLDGSLTAAGFGGLVDHVVDVEVALALATALNGPEGHWPQWQDEQRPLRWLRDDREELLGKVAGQPNASDPRTCEAAVSVVFPFQAWRMSLVDQAVRRLLGAIRDWSPVVGRSRNGVELLVTLAFIRNELIRLPQHPQPITHIMQLRYICRVLAMHLEVNSGGGGVIRSEVLSSSEGIERDARDLNLLAQVATASWLRQLKETERRMTHGQ